MSDFETVRRVYEGYVRDSGLNRASLLEEALDRIEAEVERLRAERTEQANQTMKTYDRYNGRILELEAEVERLREEKRVLAENETWALAEVERLRNGTWDEVYQDRIIALEHEVERLRAALERDAAMLDKAQAIMRKHGFKFETRLDLSEGFEKMAFTFYTLLAEVDSNARSVLAGEKV